MRPLFLTCVLLAACEGTLMSAPSPELPGPDGGSGSPGPDGGPAVGMDSGTPPELDSGVPTPLDAGLPPVDAGLGGPCGTLDSRITVVQVDVSPAHVDHSSPGGWSSNNRPVHLAGLADGSARVAFSSGGTVHVTPLNAALARSGVDFTTSGESVRGFVAHEDGAVALMVKRGSGMWLVRLKADGSTDYERAIVNDTPDVEGSRWVDGWGHEGRLISTGAHYVAYFGHTKHHGAIGKHQGDMLASFDVATGSPGGPAGWDWGCSHSMDLRLAWDGTQVAPVCLSDCYRSKGILIDDRTVLVDEPTGNCAGSSDGELGGLAPLPGGGFALTFSSQEGRPQRDVGLVTITPSRQKGAVVWLTSAGAAHPNLARYGDRLLAAWEEGSAQKLAVLSAAGAILEGPVAGGGGPALRDDFSTWPQGHVGWATGAGASLTVTRVRHCVP